MSTIKFQLFISKNAACNVTIDKEKRTLVKVTKNCMATSMVCISKQFRSVIG